MNTNIFNTMSLYILNNVVGFSRRKPTTVSGGWVPRCGGAFVNGTPAAPRRQFLYFEYVKLYGRVVE